MKKQSINKSQINNKILTIHFYWSEKGICLNYNYTTSNVTLGIRKDDDLFRLKTVILLNVLLFF